MPAEINGYVSPRWTRNRASQSKMPADEAREVVSTIAPLCPFSSTISEA